VIGGLITSTMLSLLVVPAVFTYIDDLEHWFKGLMGRNKDDAAHDVPVDPQPRLEN